MFVVKQINIGRKLNARKKIFIIFGTRPEAIKMCPLIKELNNRALTFKTVVCVTAQHRKMLDQILCTFNVKPEYDLNIMKDNQDLFDISSEILTKIKNILNKEQPDIVLVHGDTTTAFIASLAAFYLHIPIGHVEAGLRTYNLQSPWPEEFNRQSIDKVSNYLFAPTDAAKNNLLKEQNNVNQIYVTGNTGIDALKSTIIKGYSHKYLDWAKNSKLIIITAHRRENLGQPMRNMFRAMRRVLDEEQNVKAIYPIHMNPKIRKIAKAELSSEKRIKIIEPLSVIDFHNFLNASYIILTDSGGIQEEAPYLGKPVLVMRDTTERPEGINAGTLKLVGTNEKSIYKELKNLLNNENEYKAMSNATNPYGDGYASKRISDILSKQI